eukprot:1502752-Rhodomonas_salina.2
MARNSFSATCLAMCCIALSLQRCSAAMKAPKLSRVEIDTTPPSLRHHSLLELVHKDIKELETQNFELQHRLFKATSSDSLSDLGHAPAPNKEFASSQSFSDCSQLDDEWDNMRLRGGTAPPGIPREWNSLSHSQS